MQRTGKINQPSYRIVVVEHTASPKAGSFVERLGSYNPRSKERILDTDRVKYWLSVGAQPSGTMHNMLVTAGVLNEKKVNVLPKKSPPKKEGEAEAAAATAAPAEETAAEAPDSTTSTSSGQASSPKAAAEEPKAE